MRRRLDPSLTAAIRTRSPPPTPRHRESSFSMSPSPDISDRKLNLLRHASAAVRHQRVRETDDGREQVPERHPVKRRFPNDGEIIEDRHSAQRRRRESSERRVSSEERHFKERPKKSEAEKMLERERSERRRHHRHHRKNDDIKEENFLDNNKKDEEIEEEDHFLDPSTFSYNSGFNKNPQISVIPESQLVGKPTFKAVELEKQISKSPVSTNTENDRIGRLEKLVEVLLTSNLNKPSSNQLQQESTSQFELIPCNSKVTTSIWVNKIHEYCLQNGYDEKSCVKFLISKMTGIMKEWFKTVSVYEFSWPELKLLILKTFPDNLEFAATLKLLVNRTKQTNETIMQYYYSKLYLCDACKVIGENAVSCIIDGLNNPFTKQEIKSFNFLTPEALLSDYLMKYPEDVTQVVVEEPSRVIEEKYDNIDGVPLDADVSPHHEPLISKKRCFTCKKYGHIAADCRHAPICYKCKKPGHIKAQCRFNFATEKIMILREISQKNNRFHKTCLINSSFALNSTIDTGSDVTTIQESIAKQIGLSWIKSRKTFKGFGGNFVKALGEISGVHVNVDKASAQLDLFVVPDSAQDGPMLIGQSFLCDQGIVMVLDGDELKLFNQ